MRNAAFLVLVEPRFEPSIIQWSIGARIVSEFGPASLFPVILDLLERLDGLAHFDNIRDGLHLITSQQELHPLTYGFMNLLLY
eukprot:scaffold676_cov316-Pavlova_lutheri.AAC.50